MKEKATISTFLSILLGVLIVIGFYFLVNSDINFNEIFKKIPIFKKATSSQELNGNGSEKSETTTDQIPSRIPEPSPYQRQDILFLKFVSSENCIYELDGAEILRLKKLGVNGVRICPLYTLTKDGTIKKVLPDSIVVDLIKKAHQGGLAVFLEPNLGGPEGFPRLDDEKYIDLLYDISLYWANIAQEQEVEFYSPMNEPNVMWGSSDLLRKWIDKTSDLKSFFSGNIVLKLADIGPQDTDEVFGDMEGYDYIAFDIIWENSDYEELKNFLDLAVQKGDSLKEKYNLKGFFFGEIGVNRLRTDKKIQAEVFKTILEQTWKRIDGYCFLGWSELEFRFKDNEEAKKIIKEWYSKNTEEESREDF
ncbi:hypothetical protein J7K24_02025 [bacterium]|nr:hypothetical protein [bacterium]